MNKPSWPLRIGSTIWQWQDLHRKHEPLGFVIVLCNQSAVRVCNSFVESKCTVDRGAMREIRCMVLIFEACWSFSIRRGKTKATKRKKTFALTDLTTRWEVNPVRELNNICIYFVIYTRFCNFAMDKGIFAEFNHSRTLLANVKSIFFSALPAPVKCSNADMSAQGITASPSTSVGTRIPLEISTQLKSYSVPVYQDLCPCRSASFNHHHTASSTGTKSFEVICDWNRNQTDSGMIALREGPNPYWCCFIIVHIVDKTRARGKIYKGVSVWWETKS